MNNEINIPVLRTPYGTYVTLEDYIKLQQKIDEITEFINNLNSSGIDSDIYESVRKDALLLLRR